MSIVKIKPSMYKHAAELLSADHPERAAYLTPNPEGQAYYFSEFRGYVVLAQIAPHVLEIRGAFKTGNKPGFARAVVEWARALGANMVQLDCFAPVATVWAECGLLVYKIEPFNALYAPAEWQDEYGTPSVLFMRRHIGG